MSPPPLAGFDQRLFHFDMNYGLNEAQADGTITSFVCASNCVAQSASGAAGATPLIAEAILGNLLLLGKHREAQRALEGTEFRWSTMAIVNDEPDYQSVFRSTWRLQ